MSLFESDAKSNPKNKQIITNMKHIASVLEFTYAPKKPRAFNRQGSAGIRQISMNNWRREGWEAHHESDQPTMMIMETRWTTRQEELWWMKLKHHRNNSNASYSLVVGWGDSRQMILERGKEGDRGPKSKMMSKIYYSLFTNALLVCRASHQSLCCHFAFQSLRSGQ